MTMTLGHPLRLAIGSHKRGSGRGCAMNVISWESGDTEITDQPDCVDLFLAYVNHSVNDMFCVHRLGDLLCPACSVGMLNLAHRSVGSATIDGLSATQRQQTYVRIAAEEAAAVLHAAHPTAVQAIAAALAWADRPCWDNAAAAAAAARAAAPEDATTPSIAAYAASRVAWSANRAGPRAAARDAAIAVIRAWSGRYIPPECLGAARRITDRFEELTGFRGAAPDPAVAEHAVARMLVGAS